MRNNGFSDDFATALDGAQRSSGDGNEKRGPASRTRQDHAAAGNSLPADQAGDDTGIATGGEGPAPISVQTADDGEKKEIALDWTLLDQVLAVSPATAGVVMSETDADAETAVQLPLVTTADDAATAALTTVPAGRPPSQIQVAAAGAMVPAGAHSAATFSGESATGNPAESVLPVRRAAALDDPNAEVQASAVLDTETQTSSATEPLDQGSGERASLALEENRHLGGENGEASQSRDHDLPPVLVGDRPGAVNAQPADRGGRSDAPSPATSSHTLHDPVGSGAWHSELGQRLVLQARNGDHMAELRLNPPELGKIDIRITLAKEDASISIVVNNHLVKEAVEQSLPRLKIMFEQAGLTLGNVDVSDKNLQDFGRHAHQRDQSQGFAPAPDRTAAYHREAPEQSLSHAHSDSLLSVYV